ncbi:MAG: MBL fold metallo-hydrolase [Anaerolineaceae bacterium]
MHKILPVILVILVLLLGGCRSAASNVQILVTYVGNSGFLVTIGDKKVLIDGIIKGFPSEYSLPVEVTDLLYNSKPPFDKIDLILATHAHDDHFDADQIAAYLAGNPDTVFISTQEAADNTLALDNTLAERVIAVPLKSGESQDLEANGIRIKAYDISHGFGPNGETYPNLGFLVAVDGVKVFHAGDMDSGTVPVGYLQMLGLPEEQIDIAFIPHFIFRDTGSFSLATDGVAAGYFIPIHYHFTTPVFNAQLIKNVVPDAILFDKELYTWEMPQTTP